MFKKTLGAALFAAIAAVAMAVPVQAHHAASAEYDLSKRVSFDGTATRVAWINPHTQLWVTVKNDAGTLENWQLTTVGVAALRRSGEKTDQLITIGETYKLVVYPSRTSATRGLLESITLKDGRVLHMGLN